MLAVSVGCAADPRGAGLPGPRCVIKPRMLTWRSSLNKLAVLTMMLVTGCSSLVAFPAPTQDGADIQDTDVATDGADSDTHSGGGDVTLTFYQLVSFWTSYEQHGGHEVLVGPADDSVPTDASWVVVLDKAAAHDAAADRAWKNTSVDLAPTLTAKGWTSFRLAFHYVGANADTWTLDDVCVSTQSGVSDPLCDLLDFDFDDAAIGELPAGATVFSPPADTSGAPRWQATSNAGPAVSPPRGCTISFTADAVDQYLILGP